MSILCSHYAMPFVTVVGRKCGKRLFGKSARFKHSKGRRELSSGHRLYLQLANPHLRSPLLNLLLILRTCLLLPFLPRRQKPILLPLRLLCQKPHSPIPPVLPLGANA
jgi:hypothetical protein